MIIMRLNVLCVRKIGAQLKFAINSINLCMGGEEKRSSLRKEEMKINFKDLQEE
jgi:hypothetical protein